eukprot:m.785749 g.785749  ORF g.785749 m.785749 type:complete len:78 (+) comp59168_c0_seq29:47-280(+)
MFWCVGVIRAFVSHFDLVKRIKGQGMQLRELGFLQVRWKQAMVPESPAGRQSCALRLPPHSSRGQVVFRTGQSARRT